MNKGAVFVNASIFYIRNHDALIESISSSRLASLEFGHGKDVSSIKGSLSALKADRQDT